MSLNDMDSPESGNGKFAFPNMGDEPKVISQVSLDSFAETADPIDDGAALTVNASKKRHLLWLWIVLAVMLFSVPWPAADTGSSSHMRCQVSRSGASP